MFKKLTLIGVFGFITAMVLAQTDTTGKLQKYQRSSLMFLSVLHPKDSFYMDIKASVDSLPFPDKYNQIGENSFVKGSDFGDRKADLKDTLSKILRGYKVATVQPIKDKIWDNEYMAGEGSDKDNTAAKLGATFFKKKNGKDISNGMLIIEGDYME